MAGASKKRVAKEKSAAREERRSTPLSITTGSIPGMPAGVPGMPPSMTGALSNAGSVRPSPAPMSAGGSTPMSGALTPFNARFDGNASRPGSSASGSRAASPGPGARGKSQVNPKNLDLGAAAWASINDIASTGLPPRPSLNTNGQEIPINLNSYKVVAYPTKKVYQYDVLVVPGTPETKGDPNDMKRVVMEKVWKSQAVQSQVPTGVIYDGNRLAWALDKIDQLRVEVDLDRERDPSRESRRKNVFKFQLRYSTTVDFTPLNGYLGKQASWNDKCLEAVSFLDHLLRQGPSSRMFGFRRSFFSKNNAQSQLGGSVQAFKGVYASIRCAFYGPGSAGLSVNVDVANGTFWNDGTLLNAILETCGFSDKSMFMRQFQNAVSRDWRKSPIYENLKRLARVKVWSKHRNGERDDFVIERILDKTVTNYTFQLTDGTTTNLQDYYRRTYNINSEPNLPVVQMTRKINGKGIVVPVDFLRVSEWNRYSYKLDDKMTSNMIKFAVTLPNERMKAIEGGVASLNWTGDAHLNNYGLRIDTKPTQVKARLLPPPDVLFANGPIPGSQAGQGRWRIDGKKFATPNSKPLRVWGVCVIQDRGAPDQQATKNFFKQFVQIAKGHGMNVADGPPVIQPGQLNQGGEMITQIWNATGNKFGARPDILFFVMPRKDTALYRMIKKSCECRYGIVSQCLQAAHVIKNQGQYISNVCLKVNAKLGGATCRAGSKLLPKLNPKAATISTMIIGADVSHPAPGIMDQGSMAAITVSVNKECNRFAAHVQTNGRRVELIMDKVWDEMEPLFVGWMKNVGGGQLPQRLIYLRDGLSEGQYQQCLDSEVHYLHKLLKKLQPGNTTKLTVVIASKRHHIRFFPTSPAGGDRNQNPKPGVLVETGVTHPFENDFYLCSHAAIKGTARPIHFHVLKNDCEISPAEMHQMLYESSYTYARATTPVSLPPAVYYAHLASLRAIAHVNQQAVSSGKKEDGMKKQQQTASSGSQTNLPEISPLMPINNQSGIRFGMWYI